MGNHCILLNKWHKHMPCEIHVGFNGTECVLPTQGEDSAMHCALPGPGFGLGCLAGQSCCRDDAAAWGGCTAIAGLHAACGPRLGHACHKLVLQTLFHLCCPSSDVFQGLHDFLVVRGPKAQYWRCGLTGLSSAQAESANKHLCKYFPLLLNGKLTFPPLALLTVPEGDKRFQNTHAHRQRIPPT